MTTLHRFEGSPVLNAGVKITNAGDGLSQALGIEPVELKQGETVYVVLECTVGTIAFTPIKNTDGVARVQTLRAGTATIVDKDLVAAQLEEQRVRIEEATGVHRLDFDPPTDDTDDEDQVET